MKCEVIQDLLGSYIDNTCSEETRVIVEEHLKGCESCKELYEDLLNENIDHPVIEEKKVFKKVIRDIYLKLLFIVVVFTLVLFGFGTRLNSTITKMRMNLHVAMNYPEDEFEMVSFEYVDYGLQGFGVEGDYIARFEGNGQDMKINVFTDGFWLVIEDNYSHQIELRNSTAKRLGEIYSNDVNKALLKEFPEELEYCYGYLKADGQYKDNYEYLELNMLYQRYETKNYPYCLDLTFKVTEEQLNSKEFIYEVIDTLKENDFYPQELGISLINNNQVTDLPTIYNLDY